MSMGKADMRKDLVENISPGSAQHFGENALALAKYISSSPSLLPSLEHGFKRPAMVYFGYLGLFTSYTFRTGKQLFSLITVASIAMIHAFGLKSTSKIWSAHIKGVVIVVSSGAGALMSANVVAVVMQRVLGRGMSWFADPLSCLCLYGPAAFTGAS